MNLKLQIPEKLERLVSTPKRFKVVYGGRGGAKSQSFADIFIMHAHVYGDKIGCFREYQNSIEDSVHALLSAEIDRLSPPGFNVGKTQIDSDSGGCFRFKGLSRNPDGIKSMYGFNKFWVEEAQTISEDSLRKLVPTLREEGSELWLSLNPQSSSDPVSKRFLEPFKHIVDRDGFYEDDDHLIIKINYDDNPWFPAVLESDRRFDKKHLSRALYDHVWLGAYNDTVEGSIILAEWFDAAVDAHKKLGFKPVGKKVVSHDPSDEGPDPKSLVVRHGSVITKVEIKTTGDSTDGIEWALEEALAQDADLFVWDCDGLGVSLKRDVSDALDSKHCDWAMFKGSEEVFQPDAYYDGEYSGSEHKLKTNKQVFRNKRGQFYWMLRDRFYNTYRAVEKGDYVDPDKMISISSDVKNLIAFKSEICRIPKKYNPNGLIQIMNKKEMAQLKIKSPNMADGAMMNLFLGDQEVYVPVAANYNTQSSWMGL